MQLRDGAVAACSSNSNRDVDVASAGGVTMLRRMGMPAFLKPSTEVSPSSDAPVPSFSPGVDEACSALWERARSAWATQPREATPVEDEAIRATFALFLEVSRALAQH